VRRAYKFRLYPTSGQAIRLQSCLDDHRALYNAALQERREAWTKHRVSLNYEGQSAQLKDIRTADPSGQGRWSFSSQQATLRRLNRTYLNFWDKSRPGRKGFPRFKSMGRFRTVEWARNGDGCKWNSQSSSRKAHAYFRGIGNIKVRTHRSPTGRIKTLSISREDQGRNAKWFIVVSCEDVPTGFLPTTGSVVGVDMGIASFLSTSDGEHVANPRFYAKAAKELASTQQSLARKRPGSRNRDRAVARVSAIHAKVSRQRADFHHKVALALIRRSDVIVVEDLAVANMSRSASGTATQPGVNVASKSGLNRSILDAGWSKFTRILTAKAESAGRTVVRVNPANTSRSCPDCGHIAAGNRPDQATFSCESCGRSGHADVVAAINILRRGLASLPVPLEALAKPPASAEGTVTSLSNWKDDD
jgi:putative transposase